MDRKKALAIAGAVTATVTAGVAALAANFGLLTTAHEPVGKLDARSLVESTPATSQLQPRTEVTIVYEDVPVGGAVSSASGSAATPSPAANTGSTTASGSDDDSVVTDTSDDDSDDEISSEDEHEDEDEHEEEFEGIEDDD